ncbi:hemagglutinin repeat-containing protein, partial [Acinetobacter baumannii]
DTKNVAGGLSVSGGRNVGSGTGDAAGAGSNAASSGGGGKSFGFSAKADVDLRDKDNLTNQNALIQTTGGTELNVGGNATLAGANIRAGGGVSGEIGG